MALYFFRYPSEDGPGGVLVDTQAMTVRLGVDCAIQRIRQPRKIENWKRASRVSLISGGKFVELLGNSEC